MSRTKTESIRSFILENLSDHPGDIVALVGVTYGITRQAAHRHIKSLVEDGSIEGVGQTRARQYRLRTISSMSKVLRITPLLEEDIVWREYIAPALADAKASIREICYYAVTEALNNVLDHAEASRVSIGVTTTPAAIELTITDDGVGIFRRLRNHHSLVDNGHAALEITKGRLTTSPETHSGGTLFFAMKMFDRFSIHSEDTMFIHHGQTGETSMEGAPIKIRGTSIRMSLNFTSSRTLQDVFDTYASDAETGNQIRTLVPVSLLISGNDALITRSQARRLTARMGEFEEVLLDFRSVESIGRAFADEVFRTFRSQHPKVTLVTTHANADVRSRIRSALQESQAAEV